MNKIAFLFVILGLLISEVIFNWNQTYGFVIYAFLLGVVLISLEKDNYLDKSEMLLIFLMIIPIARISELFITFNFLWKIFIFYSIIAFLAVFYANKFQIRSGKTEIGNLNYTLGIVVIGILLALGAKFIFHMENSVIIFLIILIAYSEEILFRGEIQNLTKGRYGALYSIFFTSLLYGIFSISYGSSILLFGFFASLILCLVYHFTKSIYLSFLINILFHAIFFIVYPLSF